MASADLAKETAYTRILNFENAMCKRLGRSRMERYRVNLQYYQGENLPPDNVEQPLGINYAKGINEKHTHYLFGQYERDIVGWRSDTTEDSKAAKKTAQTIADHCFQISRQNDANIVLFEGGLNGSIFGDTVFRVTWDEDEQRVRWENILPEYVHFRWHPSDINKVTEVIVAYPMPREDALAMYGTAGSPIYASPNIDAAMFGFCMYWERWTAETFEIWIDDQAVQQLPNPFSFLDDKGIFHAGVIPFIHIPNGRAGGDFYGFADAEPMFLIQDELNRKLADQGDIINSFAHPITLLNKFYGDVEDLPVGPDQVWDLGPDGTAEILQWKGTPPAVAEYVETLMNIMFDLGSMSSIAYARHKGTQQSAIALAIEMMPVTEKSRWKRSFWSSALRKLMRLSVYIEQRQGVTLPFGFDEFLKYDIQVQWAPVLPRDRMLLVNENISLVVNHLRSIEKALSELGEEDPSTERDKLLKDVEELVKLGVKLQGISLTGTAGGSGSSSTPEGVNEASAKGRPRGSSNK